jgi:hypothetical protein
MAWWAIGLVSAAEPAAPPASLAAWEQCRDDALIESGQQLQAVLDRCFQGGRVICTDTDLNAPREPEALILDRCGPEPLTAKGALQARSCDKLFRFACLTPNAPFLAAKVATLDPRALGEPQAQVLDALRTDGCGELTRETFGRLICREPHATTPAPQLPGPTPGPRVLTSARVSTVAG